MNKYPCTTCKKNLNGCYRTVGKQGDRYICGDYYPVIDCSTCKRDGVQLVSRECQECTTTAPNSFINWSLKL